MGSAAAALGRTRWPGAFPAAAGVFWAFVVPVDFLNDWLVAGLARGSFRPVRLALLDMAVWWIPWVLATPLVVVAARRLDPTRLGWRRSVACHCALMVPAIYAHALAAAWIFDLLAAQPGRVWARFAHFATQFTLSEALLYWGLVGAVYLGSPGRIDDRADGDGREPERRRRFAVREGDVTRFLDVDAVDYIEAAGNYVRIHVGPRDHLLRATLSGVLERLDPGTFRRIHRSTVVNLNRVREVTAWFNGDCLVTLDDGRQLRASRTYRDGLVGPLI